MIGEYQFIFCDAGKFRLFAFLAQVSIFTVFDNVAMKHLAHALNFLQAMIGEYQFIFCDAGKFRLFAFLAQVSIFTVFDNVAMKHLAGCGAIDIAT